MRPRDPDEPHRTATPLELLFDLVFVVAVSLAAAQLHHALQEGHVGTALVGYPAAFFGIWWAWMNFAIGIVAVQALWLLSLLLPSGLRLAGFVALALAEIAVPALAERRGPHTPWHPEHVTERFGLFTIIVLGEVVLASANVFVEAVAEGEHLAELITLALAALMLVAAMWWIYFDRAQHDRLDSLAASLRWGYGHYLVFASAGATAAGIELGVDRALARTELGSTAAGLALAVPVAIFLTAVWVLALRPAGDPVIDRAVPLLAALVLLAALLPGTAVLIALLTAGCAAVVTVRRRASG